jgi:hypothetical protein
MRHLDFSADGKRVAFTTVGTDGKSHMWLASLDRRSSPRQISSSANEFNPVFGPAGDIFFLAQEGRFNFLYRVNADGTGRQKVLYEPMLDTPRVSPDGQWVALKVRYLGKKRPMASLRIHFEAGLQSASPPASTPCIGLRTRGVSTSSSQHPAEAAQIAAAGYRLFPSGRE